MRKFFCFISIIFLLPLSSAEAIQYIQSTDTNEIEVIPFAEFETHCQKIIFRPMAKKELSIKYKRLLLKAMISGQSVATLEVVLLRLKENPGYCSYVNDEEALLLARRH